MQIVVRQVSIPPSPQKLESQQHLRFLFQKLLLKSCSASGGSNPSLTAKIRIVTTVAIFLSQNLLLKSRSASGGSNPSLTAKINIVVLSKALAQLTFLSQIFLKLCKIDCPKLFYLCYS
jgi:hypothetical protein